MLFGLGVVSFLYLGRTSSIFPAVELMERFLLSSFWWLNLCRSAKPYDYLLIVVGAAGAIGAGAALPVFTILFGSLINAFNPTGGGDAFEADDLTSEINKVCLQFVYVAIGTAIASYLEVILFQFCS